MRLGGLHRKQSGGSGAGAGLDAGHHSAGPRHELSAENASSGDETPQQPVDALLHGNEGHAAESAQLKDLTANAAAAGQAPLLDQRPAAGAPRVQLPVETPVRDQEPESAESAGRLLPLPVVLGATPPTFPSALSGMADAPLEITDHAVPDTVLDGADLPGLVIRGASLRGDDHRSQQKIRQDAMGIWRVTEETTTAVLVVVADGVGSEPLSHRGAADACSTLRFLVQRHVSKLFTAGQLGNLSDFWRVMVEDMADELVHVAARLKVEPKMLSTTLAAALIETDPGPSAGRRCVFLGIGDATGYVLRDGKFDRVLANPHDGPLADTATWALPTSVGQVATAAQTIRPGDMLMVCTDGMSNPMSNDDVLGQLASWWDGSRPPDLLEFGWQLGYRVRTFGDDRTAVCVWGQ